MVQSPNCLSVSSRSSKLRDSSHYSLESKRSSRCRHRYVTSWAIHHDYHPIFDMTRSTNTKFSIFTPTNNKKDNDLDTTDNQISCQSFNRREAMPIIALLTILRVDTMEVQNWNMKTTVPDSTHRMQYLACFKHESVNGRDTKPLAHLELELPYSYLSYGFQKNQGTQNTRLVQLGLGDGDVELDANRMLCVMDHQKAEIPAPIYV